MKVKKIGDDAMLANYDVIAFFPIYGQFAAVRRLDSKSMVSKTYIFILQNLKTELKNLQHSSYTIALSKATFFVKKC